MQDHYDCRDRLYNKILEEYDSMKKAKGKEVCGDCGTVKCAVSKDSQSRLFTSEEFRAIVLSLSRSFTPEPVA